MIIASTVCCFPLILGFYVLSIVLRVSIQEQRNYGRSELIPLTLSRRKFDQPATISSRGQTTFLFENHLGETVVWRQKINGFQHMFGSALACYEIGNDPSDLLFRANEFAEYICDWNGVEESDLLDRKKDLVNNQIGRRIGTECKRLNLHGSDAEEFIARRCVETVEYDASFIAHFSDPRVVNLTDAELGCSALPKANAFNAIRSLLNRRPGRLQ